MDMIIYLLLISVALIYWFQLSIYNKNNNSSNKTKKYFNKIKLPIIVFCLLVIVTDVCNFNKKPVLNNNLDVFTTNANF